MSCNERELSCPPLRRRYDLRHTWASWHVQAGTPLHVPQELGRWESAEMVRRYAHFSSEHLAEHVDRMSARLTVVDEGNMATFQLRRIKQDEQ